MPHESAVQRILDGRGTHFHPDVVDAFVTVAHDMARVRLESQAVFGAKVQREQDGTTESGSTGGRAKA
jgi:hypothetical protein